MIYSITSGKLSKNDGEVILTGCYSGGDAGQRPDAVNNPAMCNVRPNVGPIPIGKYTVGPLLNHPHLGPAMALTPNPANVMFGGSGFYIHYSNPTRDAGLPPYPPPAGRNSSDGCIVCITPGALPGVATIVQFGERDLTVTA